jgi:tRNA(Met) C34 N-acetyltransferase TmcA
MVRVENGFSQTAKNLELESVGSLALGKGELGRQVLAEVLDLVDGLKDNLVGSLLEGDLVSGKGLLLLLTLEESLLSSGLLGSLGAGKVGIVQLSIDLQPKGKQQGKS